MREGRKYDQSEKPGFDDARINRFMVSERIIHQGETAKFSEVNMLL